MDFHLLSFVRLVLVRGEPVHASLLGDKKDWKLELVALAEAIYRKSSLNVVDRFCNWKQTDV